jgi:hypothetical protein
MGTDPSRPTAQRSPEPRDGASPGAVRQALRGVAGVLVAVPAGAWLAHLGDAGAPAAFLAVALVAAAVAALGSLSFPRVVQALVDLALACAAVLVLATWVESW